MTATHLPSFASEISPNLQHQVGELLQRWLQPEDCSSTEVSVLAGGAINRSFVVRHADGRRSVLRLAADPERTAWLSVDMAMSVRVSKLAGEAGVGPRVLGAQVPEGHSLIEFLDGVLDVGTIHQPGAIAAIGTAVRKVHELPTDGIRVVSVFDDIDDWLGSARDYDALPGERLAVVEPWLESCRSLFAEVHGICVCHRDINPQNCVWAGQEARLIDWDFAAVDSPYLDLAMLIDYAELSPEETDAYVRAVIGQPTAVDTARIRLMQLVNSVREWAWCLNAVVMLGGQANPLTELLPGGGGGHDDFYTGYREVNWQRLQSICADPDLEATLGAARSDLPAPGFR